MEEQGRRPWPVLTFSGSRKKKKKRMLSEGVGSLCEELLCPPAGKEKSERGNELGREKVSRLKGEASFPGSSPPSRGTREGGVLVKSFGWKLNTHGQQISLSISKKKDVYGILSGVGLCVKGTWEG